MCRIFIKGLGRRNFFSDRDAGLSVGPSGVTNVLGVEILALERPHLFFVGLFVVVFGGSHALRNFVQKIDAAEGQVIFHELLSVNKDLLVARVEVVRLLPIAQHDLEGILENQLGGVFLRRRTLAMYGHSFGIGGDQVHSPRHRRASPSIVSVSGLAFLA